MELLRFDRLEDLDFPKLMEIYREGNLRTIPFFFPDETDPERGLRGVEEKFYEYYQTDFYAAPGRRSYVLADGDRWVSALRLFPVPGQKGAWHAEALATAADCRRRGYAKRLFELLFRALGAEGPFVVTNSVNRDNAASLALHEAAGFQLTQDPACCPLNGKTNPKAFGFTYRFEGWEAPSRLPVEGLSTRYLVRRLEETDVPALLALCAGNPQFYRHCPPPATAQSLREDMAALPPRKTLNDKYYLGFFDGTQLVAVLDLIAGFPGPEIAFWGFFMLDATIQGQGRGTALVSELCGALRSLGFRSVRLGWVRTNPQAAHFWKKNGFRETGVSYETGGYTVVVAQRELT